MPLPEEAKAAEKKAEGSKIRFTSLDLSGCRQKSSYPKMSTRIKICGITNHEDAQVSVAAGADALGLNFYKKSPRYLTISAAAKIAKKLPSFLMRVGVFVNAPESLVLQAIGECGLSMLQFHGDETPEFCTQFGLMSMKAFRIRGAEALKELPQYPTEAWLLDAYTPKTRGGTGKKFNWELAVEAKKFGRPFFLAGGLTPGNVADAVRRVRPFGVDVSSGVESAPGKKDHQKVRDFIAKVRQAEKK
jgi:phosphoribosylanthranilate isomerase